MSIATLPLGGAGDGVGGQIDMNVIVSSINVTVVMRLTMRDDKQKVVKFETVIDYSNLPFTVELTL